MEALVKSAVDTAKSELTTVYEAKLKEVSDAKTALEEKVATLETEKKTLQEDIARIPVSGTPQTVTKSYFELTDRMARKSLGYTR